MAEPAGNGMGETADIGRSFRGDETVPDPILTGWTLVANYVDNATSSRNRIIVLRKDVGSNAEPDESIPDYGQKIVVGMIALRGVTTTTVVDAGSTDSTTSVSIGGGDVGTDAFVMDFMALRVDSDVSQIASGFTNADLTDLTNRWEYNSSLNDGFGLYLATGTASGVVGATEATLSSGDRWNAVKIAAT